MHNLKCKLFTEATWDLCMLCALACGFCVSRKGDVVGSPAGYDPHYDYWGWQ